VLSKKSRHLSSAHEQAALEISLKGVAGEVGTTHESCAAVDDQQLGVHGGVRGRAPAGHTSRRADKPASGSPWP